MKGGLRRWMSGKPGNWLGVWTFEEINHPLHLIFYNFKYNFGVIFFESVFDSNKNI